MTKVVLAPDSFKGTLSSIEVCDLLERAILDVVPYARVVKVPVADGGEGTVDAFLAALGGTRVEVDVLDPLSRPIRAAYGLLPDGTTAVVETAAASGLTLVPEPRDPTRATTFGTGQLVRDALDRGCTRILLGLGGSATNDGGAGLAAALGVRLLDEWDEPVEPTGGGLAYLSRIDASGLDPRLAACELLVACDVDNPLCGPQGASAVFGPQKGATPEQVSSLDRHLAHYADLLLRDCGADVREIPGTGAAGGLAASLLAFVPRCSLVPGIRLLLDAVGFDALLSDADLVVVGEGKMDGQSVRGKAPVGVAERAARAGVPCVAVVGALGEGWEAVLEHGIRAVYRTSREGAPWDEVLRTCREDLVEAGRRMARIELGKEVAP